MQIEHSILIGIYLRSRKPDSEIGQRDEALDDALISFPKESENYKSKVSNLDPVQLVLRVKVLFHPSYTMLN
jgi:hypothetical protein